MSEENEPDRAASKLSALRGLRDEIKAETTTKIAIPGSRGQLAAEYEVVEFGQERQLEKRYIKAAEHGHRELHFWMDQLIAACVGFHVKGADGGWEPVDPDSPVRYDERLAAGLGLDVPVDEKTGRPAARDVLEAVFAAYEPNEKRVPYRISVHHSEFLEWMQGTADEDDEGAAADVEAAFLDG